MGPKALLSDRAGPDNRNVPVDTVRLSRLTKDYKGTRALDDVSLSVGPGEVFGYLGPNGAGKTTTIRILMGLLRPSAGEAEVLGMDSWRDRVAAHARIGYLPGEAAFPAHLTGAEVIRYYARLRSRPGDLDVADKLADRLDVDLAQPVHALSRGNRQKVAIIQALMSEPELVVLDEPSSGLDPLVQQEFHALLHEATGRGATVLLSSHVLGEVQRMADRVGIIRSGRLIAVERLEDLRARALHRVVARVSGPVGSDAFAPVPGIRNLDVAEGVIRAQIPALSLDRFVKALAGFRVLDLSVQEADLEEMFLSYYGRSDDPP